MTGDFSRVQGTKKEQYRALLPQIVGLISGEDNVIANMANMVSVLKTQFDFFWVGFYLVDENADELVLGPFQGPVACTRIGYGKGVCGSAWSKAQTLIVPNVDEFPGHIACSSLSKSEIVVPLIRAGRVWAVLDVDSDALDQFDDTDALYLGEICGLLNT
jgi:L-methionine (R)-S-oxide reductase